MDSLPKDVLVEAVNLLQMPIENAALAGTRRLRRFVGEELIKREELRECERETDKQRERERGMRARANVRRERTRANSRRERTSARQAVAA